MLIMQIMLVKYVLTPTWLNLRLRSPLHNPPLPILRLGLRYRTPSSNNLGLCCRSSLLLGLTFHSPSLSHSLPRPRISYLFYGTPLTVIHISTNEPLHQCPQHNPLLTLSSSFPSSSAKCLNYQPT